MQPNNQQSQKPVQQNIPTPPPTHDPTSLESFIRQSSVQQSTGQQTPISSNQTLFQWATPNSQIIEKIIYKKQRVHWFFRTLTILALVVVWFLMLLEALNVFSLNINWFNLNIVYPVFIILSSIVIWSYRGLFGKIFWLLLFLVVVWWFFIMWVYTSLNPSVQTKFWSYISYPSNLSAQYSKLYINTLVSDLTLVGKEINNFLEWNYWSDRSLNIFSWTKSNYQYYSIQEQTNLNLIENYYSILSFGVNSKQPLYLYIKTLFSLQNIDLSNTLTKEAKLHSASTMSDIIVNSSLKNLDIQSALADTTIHLPKDVWVKLKYKHLLWKLELVDFEQKWPGYFESTNIASSSKIVNINIKYGFARTKIVWDK